MDFLLTHILETPYENSYLNLIFCSNVFVGNLRNWSKLWTQNYQHPNFKSNHGQLCAHVQQKNPFKLKQFAGTHALIQRPTDKALPFLCSFGRDWYSDLWLLQSKLIFLSVSLPLKILLTLNIFLHSRLFSTSAYFSVYHHSWVFFLAAWGYFLHPASYFLQK